MLNDNETFLTTSIMYAQGVSTKVLCQKTRYLLRRSSFRHAHLHTHTLMYQFHLGNSLKVQPSFREYCSRSSRSCMDHLVPPKTLDGTQFEQTIQTRESTPPPPFFQHSDLIAFVSLMHTNPNPFGTRSKNNRTAYTVYLSGKRDRYLFIFFVPNHIAVTRGVVRYVSQFRRFRRARQIDHEIDIKRRRTLVN